MFNHTSYVSGLGKPALHASHAIQSKANAGQRVGGKPTISLDQLRSQFEKALQAYERRKPLKDGGSCRVNYDLVTEAIDSLNQLLEHPDLPNDHESESLRTLQSELIEKRPKYNKRLLKRRRSRPVRRLGRSLLGGLSSLSQKLSSLSQKFWQWMEPPSSFR